MIKPVDTALIECPASDKKMSFPIQKMINNDIGTFKYSMVEEYY